MKRSVFQITLITLLVIHISVATADVSGKMIAYACYSCHGEKLINLNIKQSGPLSSIKLTQTLLAFKTNNKSATIMDRITKGYTDSELKAVAEYIIN